MTQAEVAVSRRTILLLDDEPLVVDFVRKALRKAGYEVIAAADVQTARSLFNRHAVDLALIISEIALPKVNGPEFISSLPTLEPRIPVIFMTCLGEQEIALKALDYPAAVLHKPVKNADLKTAIQSVAIR